MISVIMLTYNRQQFVGRAIKSIIAQTYRDFEFIIVDNGSTDESGIIADDYAKNDHRLKVLHISRQNIGAGRNAGLDVAIGDYIVFIDDDDFAEADFLEFLLNLAKKHDADVAICGASGAKNGDECVMNGEEAVIELMRREKYNVAFPAKLFRRKCFSHERFPLTGKFDDIALMYRILADAEKIAYDGIPKYTFYRHNGNNSAWTTNHSLLSKEILDEYLAAYRARTDFLIKKFPNSADVFRYFEWSFMISMVEKINRLEIKGCDAELIQMVKTLNENRDVFAASPLTEPFEKAWLKAYVPEKDEEIVYERFCFPVTFSCNLSCRLCAEHAPYAKKPYFPKLDEIKRELDALFPLVEHIKKFDITGGEPFLRKDLNDILEFIRQEYSDKIDVVRVTTNGTILPSADFIEAAKKWGQRIYVIVDKYEVSPNSEKICTILESQGIPHELRDYDKNLHFDGWVDYGDLRRKHNEEEAKKVFSRCMVPKLGFFTCMVNGFIYPCARARLLHEHLVLSACMSVYDEELTPAGKKARLKALLEDEVTLACQYCDGLCEDSPRVKPAEQIPKGDVCSDEFEDWQLKYGRVAIYTQTYNNESTIGRTIDSVLNQTSEDFTYFICNNGSSDKTDSIIRERIANTDRHVVYMKFDRNDILGVALARTRALSYMPEYLDPYYTIVDGDDTIEENFVFEVKKAIEKYSPDMVIPSYKRISGDNDTIISERSIGQDVTLYRPRKDFDIMKVRPLLLIQGGVVHRWNKQKKMTYNLVRNYTYVFPKWFVYLDALYNLSGFLEYGTISLLANTAYNYYVYTDSICRSYVPDRVHSDELMYTIYAELVNKYCPDDKISADYCYAVYMSLLEVTLSSILAEKKSADVLDVLRSKVTREMFTNDFDPVFNNLAHRDDFFLPIIDYLASRKDDPLAEKIAAEIAKLRNCSKKSSLSTN